MFDKYNQDTHKLGVHICLMFYFFRKYLLTSSSILSLINSSGSHVVSAYTFHLINIYVPPLVFLCLKSSLPHALLNYPHHLLDLIYILPQILLHFHQHADCLKILKYYQHSDASFFFFYYSLHPLLGYHYLYFHLPSLLLHFPQLDMCIQSYVLY